MSQRIFGFTYQASVTCPRIRLHRMRSTLYAGLNRKLRML